MGIVLSKVAVFESQMASCFRVLEFSRNVGTTPVPSLVLFLLFVGTHATMVGGGLEGGKPPRSARAMYVQVL